MASSLVLGNSTRSATGNVLIGNNRYLAVIHELIKQLKSTKM